MKKYYFLYITTCIVIIVCADCTNQNNKVATISTNSDSAYVNTFKDLNLGVLYDFKFKLPKANERWVKIWVERYNEGKKDPKPLTQLSYGLSPKEVEEGHLSFGIINPNSENSLVFLSAPGASQEPRKIKSGFDTNLASTGGYTIGDEKVELKLGETNVLGVYRQSSETDSIKTYDLQDEGSIKQMIKKDNMVLLLKIKVEKGNDDRS